MCVCGVGGGGGGEGGILTIDMVQTWEWNFYNPIYIYILQISKICLFLQRVPSGV